MSFECPPPDNLLIQRAVMPHPLLLVLLIFADSRCRPDYSFRAR
jgi:hypothetical protein